jgi:hypothetical protein
VLPNPRTRLIHLNPFKFFIAPGYVDRVESPLMCPRINHETYTKNILTWRLNMFTKIAASVLLVGSLWVGGDAAYKHFGCCQEGLESSSAPSACCLVNAKAPKADCCSTGSECCQPVSECCLAVKAKVSTAAPQPCCDAEFTFCTRTGVIYEGCCCEVVNGQYRCLITGDVSDECCCIPLND